MKLFMQTAIWATLVTASAYVVAAPVQKAQGVGIIKAVEAQSVTLSHEAIPALNWSAMTMPFPLAKPELAKGLAVGQKVAFDLEVAGSNFKITAIKVIK